MLKLNKNIIFNRNLINYRFKHGQMKSKYRLLSVFKHVQTISGNGGQYIGLDLYKRVGTCREPSIIRLISTDSLHFWNNACVTNKQLKRTILFLDILFRKL